MKENITLLIEKIKKINKKVLGGIVLFVVIGLITVICSSGEGSGNVRASPSSDFSYDLSYDGRGIIITRYTGTGGRVVIPARIEGLPVIGIQMGILVGNGFAGNNRITEIVIPDSIIELGVYAFSEMSELRKVTLPNGLKIIPEGAFGNNPKLTSINLPSSLEEIHGWAFGGCSELNELIIPASLTGVKWMFGSIEETGNGAFQRCQKLPIRTRQTIQNWSYTGGF